MVETNPRQEKGKKIAQKSNQIKRVDEFTYSVKSQTSHVYYSVIKTESGFVCNCPDHTFRHVCCKHIHAVEFSIKLREQVRQENSVTIEQLDVSVCPKCTSENFVKHGIRKNKNYSIQRYFCNDCKKWFSFNIGFERMKHDPKAITSALQLYFTGESLRNVQKFLRLQGVEVSHQTVLNWITKYTKLMKQHLDKITPQVGDAWRADEVFVKVKGDMKYLFALMDDETRFWIAKEVANRKFGHNAEGLLKQAKEVTGTKPKVFITDGLHSYSVASRKEFWARKREDHTTHIRHITLKGDHNNNKMERMNGEFRDRERVTRGIKKTDSVIFDGYQLYHNYIRPHMGLNGKTPSEMCGITIKGDNKWKTLIQQAILSRKSG